MFRFVAYRTWYSVSAPGGGGSITGAKVLTEKNNESATAVSGLSFM
jgi:hypothetical protein